MTKKITVVALETLIAQHNNIHLIDVREEHEYRGAWGAYSRCDKSSFESTQS